MHQVNISGIIYKNQKGDWIHSGYASAMKEFRKSFKYNIQRLSEEYQLTFFKRNTRRILNSIFETAVS